MHYSMYYREELNINKAWESWSIFISAYNASERVKTIFEKVNANNKIWLIFPEYEFTDEENPSFGHVIKIKKGNEVVQILDFISNIDLLKYKQEKICIDITGFLRAQLLFLMAYLLKNGFKDVDFIYSEPSYYTNKEDTVFSRGSVSETRQVLGFQGASNLQNKKDLMIIAAGYDVSLISKAAQYNENAEIVPMLGFPSLRADMFQENVLKTALADESFSIDALRAPILAPAFDPFETASILTAYIINNNCLNEYGHIYLCPLSAKPQVLGIGLSYLDNFTSKSVSILYPFTSSYDKETSVGISRIWKYTI